jgi:hypothetical protein
MYAVPFYSPNQRHLRKQAPQHSAPGAQHSPPSQQSLTFALVMVKPQHACGGLQQSPSGQQLVAVTLAAPAKQHSWGGLQQSAPGTQQLIFMLDVPPPRMPKSSANGASSFNVITDLQLLKRSKETVNLTRSNAIPRLPAAARRLTAPDALEQMERTGKRGREFIELPAVRIRCCESLCIGERQEGHRLWVTGSNACRRRGKRGRAAASLDEWRRLRRRRGTAGFIGTTAAGWLRRLGCIVAAATGSARRHGGRSRRLHG